MFNSMPFPHFHQMSGRVQVEISCPSCSARMKDGRLLEHYDDTHVSHFQCEQCSHYSLAYVYQSQMGISSVVVMTDLCYEDVVRMKRHRPISADDVIALHQVLNHDQAAHMFSRTRKLH